MLNTSYRLTKAFLRVTTLQIFISVITFQSSVSADIKQETAQQYHSQGFADQQKGNLNDALTNYNKAISLGFESPELFNDMGILYEQIDLRTKDEENYLRAIQINKNFLPAYMNLAYFYKKLGMKEKAFKFFKLRFELAELDDPWANKAKEELLTIRPEYQAWAVHLEADRLNQLMTKKAHEDFLENIKKSNAYYQSGSVLFDEGKFNLAIGEFDRALHISPGNPKVIKARDKALKALAKKNVKDISAQAIHMINAGDTKS
ncbi:MAG: tetratricopeptide repeat protein, partial [Candidatus Omnitrophica bacterium]|nr:tetratricopeptide repeat protein [Candidatus Omnitrophota bacterium]